ncbi:MAG: diadenylate cyclase CdaA [Lachnospiraceae bacterium]|nr:diadenylate cyclase CdaA [Lachnospiraceae bacterium]
MPRIGVGDVFEILLLAALVYVFIAWIKRTRAYMLLRGILIVAVFILLAWIFQFSTILWILEQLGSVALISLVVIFGPELRKALESLGNSNYFFGMLSFGGSGERTERFPDTVLNDIVSAVSDMSEVKTGALIVIEQNILLNEYVDTGIRLDSLISRQLLVNIFEHNTPLHDGAVIIRGDRIIAATCYLPLSENVSISKRFGTRHRAGLGISEVSDSFTIIVSEETGKISCAYMGELSTLTAGSLREQLHYVQNDTIKDRNDRKFRIWKRREEA